MDIKIPLSTTPDTYTQSLPSNQLHVTPPMPVSCINPKYPPMIAANSNNTPTTVPFPNLSQMINTSNNINTPYHSTTPGILLYLLF